MQNATKTANFGFNDYGAEEADIERRRAYAQAMQQQGMQPLGPTEQIGGWEQYGDRVIALMKTLLSRNRADG